MPINIEFNDATGLSLYAFLFDSINKELAFSPTTNKFEIFDLSKQSDFVLVLTEDVKRVGFYSHVIANTSGVPSTIKDNWYLAEVYQVIGSSPERLVDRILGAQPFYWDGTKEIPLGGANVQVDLSGVPGAVWNNSIRTLTQPLECPDDVLTKLIEEKTKELADLITNATRQGTLPNTQIPRFGPLGSSAGNKGIRFNRSV